MLGIEVQLLSKGHCVALDDLADLARERSSPFTKNQRASFPGKVPFIAPLRAVLELCCSRLTMARRAIRTGFHLSR
jgi:hypothetical protein